MSPPSPGGAVKWWNCMANTGDLKLLIPRMSPTTFPFRAFVCLRGAPLTLAGNRSPAAHPGAADSCVIVRCTFLAIIQRGLRPGDVNTCTGIASVAIFALLTGRAYYQRLNCVAIAMVCQNGTWQRTRVACVRTTDCMSATVC